MARGSRDIERIYTTGEIVAKLRRLADALEADKPFRIQIGGERIRVHGRDSRLELERTRPVTSQARAHELVALGDQRPIPP